MCFSLERISPTMLNLLLLLWEDCQSATKSPGRADLTLLFSVAAQEAKHSRAPKPILRWKVHFLHSSSPSSHSRSPTYNRNIKYLKTQPDATNYHHFLSSLREAVHLPVLASNFFQTLETFNEKLKKNENKNYIGKKEEEKKTLTQSL